MPRSEDRPPAELQTLLPTFVRLAQKTYDDWSQDPETDDLGGGGICHLIADELVGAMTDRGIVCTSVSAHIGEVHVYSIARLASGVWLVDIEPSVYERGSAYTWTKIPDVNFEESDITIELLDPDPKNFRDYVEEDSDVGDYEPNVRKKAWVEQLLTKRDKIEKAIGMPLGTMLGCGHWGCVFESTQPWVVKLSIDPTEGPIWSKIAGLLRDEQWGLQGFPEIKSIHRITPDLVTGGRKRKVWAIVRENVEPVFKEYKARELGLHGGGTVLRTSPYTTEKLGLHAPVGAYDFQRPRGEVDDAAVILGLRRPIPQKEPQVWTPQQEDFGRAIDGLMKYKMLATAWHVLGEVPRSLSQRNKIAAYRSEYGTREAVAEQIQRVTDMGFNGGAFAPLGKSLSMLASHGVYLRDVHILNIGWHIARDADDWDRIVIFDPGHTPTAGGKDIEEALVENRRVYHGTPHVFAMGEATSSRGTYGPGFYFTTKLKEAEWYAESRKRLALVSPSALAAAGGIGEPTVVECDVDLRAPLHYFDVFPEEQSGPQPFRDFSEDELRLRFLIRDEGAGSSIQQLQALGYDGIIVDLSRQKATDDRTYYIVFDPTSLSCERQLIGREAL